jgi:hypothetical protein
MKEGKKVTLYFPAPIWAMIEKAKKQTPFASPSKLIQDAIAARYGVKAGKGGDAHEQQQPKLAARTQKEARPRKGVVRKCARPSGGKQKAKMNMKHRQRSVKI